MYYIGVDVGTTGTKTVVVDAAGTVVGKGYQEYGLITGPGGVVEQNAEDWWNAVIQSVRAAVSQIPDPGQIAALSLSAQGGSTLPVDRDFRPLRRAFTWMDARAVRESDAIQADCGESIYQASGWRCDPSFDPPKCRWLAKHDPEMFQKAAYFVSTAEYVQFQLTGRNVIDPTNAAMRQLLNIRTADWDDTLLNIAGLTRDRLPKCLPVGAPLGRLTAQAAALLHLPETVMVYNGAHDQYCASLGSGAVQPGNLLLSTGTTWVIFAVTKEPLFTASHIAPGVHPIAGLYGNIASLNSGGSALNWYKQVAGEEFAKFDAEAAGRRDSAEGLLFYPYYAGAGFPHHDAPVKACCAGMELMHDKYDVARALMEGVAFEARSALEEFRAQGADIRSLKMVGGAAKSGLWSAITADVTGCEIRIPTERDTCCIGAAMIAAVGSGFYKDYAEAARKMVRYSKVIAPQRDAGAFYEKKYRRYRKNYENIQRMFQDV